MLAAAVTAHSAAVWADPACRFLMATAVTIPERSRCTLLAEADPPATSSRPAGRVGEESGQ
jgi:hypothetical protein